MPDPVFLENKINYKPKSNKKKNYKYILNVGRLTKQKNHKMLIEAFKKISTKYSQLKLIILGDGEKIRNKKANRKFKSKR